jgi:hypothetical protein
MGATEGHVEHDALGQDEEGEYVEQVTDTHDSMDV